MSMEDNSTSFFTSVKNQIKTFNLTIKYATMKELLNKATFISNILFMILNNSTFIIQWLVIFSIRDSIGNYGFKDIILLWGIAAETYGISHFFFKKSFTLSDTINNGKLDSYLVLPKNVLISVISSDIEVSAIGDMIYGYIMLCVYGLSFSRFVKFSLLAICGGLIFTSYTTILSSLSFWFSRSDYLADTLSNSQNSFATYPESIFKNSAKFILFTVVPVGFVNYIPIRIIKLFDWKLVVIDILATVFFISLAFLIFNKGLKRYSSTNLMISKI